MDCGNSDDGTGGTEAAVTSNSTDRRGDGFSPSDPTEQQDHKQTAASDSQPEEPMESAPSAAAATNSHQQPMSLRTATDPERPTVFSAVLGPSGSAAAAPDLGRGQTPRAGRRASRRRMRSARRPPRLRPAAPASAARSLGLPLPPPPPLPASDDAQCPLRPASCAPPPRVTSLPRRAGMARCLRPIGG
ncbi:uncharacterized protein LOC126273204 [Schistocerca gregaria]|uniref:uncharacterized protein LOC126273204 n=1 Tax=Schistocerca gregaria TaxID=7010 RepID=UPI00211DCE8D|nr:uncharacterized protein LOC126273204 [Schistocerca gregaria]